MNDESHNDDILFDRLVDGELSTGEQRALLESLDSRPQGWRRCALAFLEAQSWQSELRSVAAKPQAAAAVTKSSAPSPPAKRTTMWAAVQWLAVAASLLIAFKIGALQRGAEFPIANNPTTTNEQLVSTPPAAGAAAPNVAKRGDALNLWVRDDAGQMRRVRVPLVDASALDNELGLQFQTGVPDDVRARLQHRGYTVQSKRQYAPMWLDNGRPMIVPVEDTKIVPVSNKVY
jgi:hypothetical protein